MGMLGNKPAAGFQSIEKQSITGNGGTTYALDHAVTSVNDLEVFVNNVRQEPTTAYTISGQNIVMSEAIANTDSFYLIYQSRSFTKAVPADTSVTAAMLNADVQTSNDARYVNTTGDTMTGNLTVGGIISATGTSTNTNPEADIGLYHSFKNLNADVNTGVAITLGSNNSSSATIYAQRTGANNEHKMGFQTRNNAGSALTRMAIDGSGSVTTPYQPGWHGTHADHYNSTYSAGQAHNMDASLERYNVGNHFNYSNDRFTCPVTGYYLVYGWDICHNSTSVYNAGNAIGCWKNGYSGGNRLVSVYRQYNRGYSFTGTAYLVANDYVTFGNSEGSIGAGAYYGSTSYSGYGIRLLG